MDRPPLKNDVMIAIHTHANAFAMGGDTRDKAWETVFRAWEAAEGCPAYVFDPDLLDAVTDAMDATPSFASCTEEERHAAHWVCVKDAIPAWHRLYGPEPWF